MAIYNIADKCFLIIIVILNMAAKLDIILQCSKHLSIFDLFSSHKN